MTGPKPTKLKQLKYRFESSFYSERGWLFAEMNVPAFPKLY